MMISPQMDSKLGKSNGKERWTADRFTKNLNETVCPIHLIEIRSYSVTCPIRTPPFRTVRLSHYRRIKHRNNSARTIPTVGISRRAVGKAVGEGYNDAAALNSKYAEQPVLHSISRARVESIRND